MKKAEEDHELIRRYLLGDLSGAERELFEERVITDPDYKEQVLIIENELIEDYLEDDLLEFDQQKFVQHFLSTPRQLQKLELSRALKRYAASARLDDTPQPSEEELPIKRRSWWMQFLRIQRPVIVFSLATVTILAFIVVWVVVIRGRHNSLEEELIRLNDERGTESPLDSKRSVLGVMLTPGQLRGAGKENNIRLPPGTEVVQLRLALMSAEHPSYHATLRNLEGTEVFTLSGLKARDFNGVRYVTINIPARALVKDDYLLTLSGSPPDGRSVEVAEYSFRVVDG